MGRTSKKRKQKKFNAQKLQITENDALMSLKSWLFSQNFHSICDLIPDNFPFTGRGLKTLRDIEENEILIKLPEQLLITTVNVSRSNVRNLFLPDQAYSAQYVLSIFLIYEAHLGNTSKWYPYINSLPRRLTTPEFCTQNEKKLLPDYIIKYMHRFHALKKDFSLFVQLTKELKKIRNDYCSHCNIPFEKIVTFSAYRWAYYIVNTRSVHIDLKTNQNNIINIKYPNNIALAPFLDLFNHDVNTSSIASMITDNQINFYQIITLKQFKEGSEVFINYGPHNNLKLYVDYGFYVPCNPLDEIYFNILDITSCINISKNVLDYIMYKKFHENMAFTSEGLNYNALITLFLLTTKLQKKDWNLKIYKETFNLEDRLNIHNLALKILNIKRIELINSLSNMKNIKNCSKSFLVATNLVEEYVKILKISEDNLKKTLIA